MSIIDGAVAAFMEPDYTRYPVEWIEKRTGGFCWSKSRECAEMVEAYDRVAIKACHDSAKSWTAARLAGWWIDVHPPGTARVVTTAPTGAQVKGVLWNEIGQMFSQAAAVKYQLPGRVNLTEWWINRYQAGVGRKPSDTKQEHFSGIHAPYMLVIIDEGGGVPESIFDAAETIATNQGAKIFTIGNPDDPQSYFRRIFEEPDLGYETMSISAWSTPNFTGEKVPELLNRVLLQPEWVERRRKGWGEDHPFWQSKVEAEFPTVDVQTIVKALDLQNCSLDPDELAPKSPADDNVVQLGVDVGGSETGDKTIIRERRGRRALRRWEIQSGDPTVIHQGIRDAALEANPSLICIDSIGVGLGFVASLRNDLPNSMAVVPVDVRTGAPTKGPKGNRQYRNLRAELWWEYGREYSRKRYWDLTQAENLEDLIADLATPRYKTEKGVITVEAKDEIKKRLGRSPDDGDAHLLSFIKPVGGGKVRLSSAARRGALPGRASGQSTAPGVSRSGRSVVGGNRGR